MKALGGIGIIFATLAALWVSASASATCPVDRCLVEGFEVNPELEKYIQAVPEATQLSYSLTSKVLGEDGKPVLRFGPELEEVKYLKLGGMAFKVLPNFEGEKGHHNISMFRKIEEDRPGYVAFRFDPKIKKWVTFVVFRGTETHEYEGILSAPGWRNNFHHATTKVPLSDGSMSLVKSGFQEQVQSTFPTLESQLGQVYDGMKNHPFKGSAPILTFVIGHSKGGALAHLGSRWILDKFHDGDNSKGQVFVVTLSAAKAVDQEYRKDYHRIMGVAPEMGSGTVLNIASAMDVVVTAGRYSTLGIEVSLNNKELLQSYTNKALHRDLNDENEEEYWARIEYEFDSTTVNLAQMNLEWLKNYSNSGRWAKLKRWMRMGYYSTHWKTNKHYNLLALFHLGNPDFGSYFDKDLVSAQLKKEKLRRGMIRAQQYRQFMKHFSERKSLTEAQKKVLDEALLDFWADE